MKIKIHNRFTPSSIFCHSCANNSYAQTLRAAYEAGAYLDGALLGWGYYRGIVLPRVAMRHASLMQCDFRDANLQGANLQGAQLECTWFIHANLRDANMRGADLRGAHLRDADLYGADLSYARLSGAELPPLKVWRDENSVVLNFLSTNCT